MPIASGHFLGLIIASLLAYHLPVRADWWRPFVITLVSAVYLWTYVPTGAGASLYTCLYIAPLFLFAAIGFFGLAFVRRKRGLAVILLLILVSYLWLRKFNFMISVIPISSNIVVVGVSYILFRMLQVLIDYAQQEIREKPSLGLYMLHIFSFYTLASGPIWRYQNHAQQIKTVAARSLGDWDAYAGFSRIFTGFIKCLLFVPLLDRNFLVASKYFATLRPHNLAAFPTPELLLSNQQSILYALSSALYLISLYFNFSGYMDIVNGCCRLFLLKPPENFASPFQSKNFNDIWSRWHITLSDFFKLYVFNPIIKVLSTLFPSINVQFFGVVAFFITFCILGLWHGTTERFAYYGLALGFCVSVNKAWDIFLGRLLSKPAKKALQGNTIYKALAGAIGMSSFAVSLSLWWLDPGFVPAFSPHACFFLALSFAVLSAIFYVVRLCNTAFINVSSLLSSRIGSDSPYGHYGVYQLYILSKLLIVLVLLFTSGHTAPQFVYQNF